MYSLIIIKRLSFVFQCEILHCSHCLCSFLPLIFWILQLPVSNFSPEEVVKASEKGSSQKQGIWTHVSTHVKCYQAEWSTCCALPDQRYTSFLQFWLICSSLFAAWGKSSVCVAKLLLDRKKKSQFWYKSKQLLSLGHYTECSLHCYREMSL